MADLRGGATVSGYPILHSGMGSVALPGNLTLNGTLTVGSAIYGAYGNMFRSADEWLRINDLGEHTNGIYCGSGILRTDGNFQVGGNGTYFNVTSTGVTTCTGSLTINKSGNSSTITFPAQTNDPGYISHYENNNTARMYFCVSDDRDGNDCFSWGSTPGGTYSECMYLYTNGSLYTGQVFNAVYNDYAEFFEKKIGDTDTPEAGDVIMVSNDEESYIKCDQAYSKLVVGAFSDDYAQCIGGEKKKKSEEQYEKFSPIGLAGRIRVKVTGNVTKGDLLVSSHIKGVAMSEKDKHIPGTVIGKALENHSGDSIDRIKMLIMNT